MDSLKDRGSPLRTAVLALVLAVAGVGFLRSVEDTLGGYDRRASRGGPPLSWRLGKAPAVALESCLAAARPFLPAGRTVAFAGPVEPRSVRFLRWRWASYFLADRDLVEYHGGAMSGGASYVVACRRDLAGDPRLVELERLPWGRLYAIRGERETRREPGAAPGPRSAAPQ